MNKLNLTQNNKYLSWNNKVLAAPSTFSKTQLFGTGTTPVCIIKGDGAYTWDVDNNKYIDYIMGLGCVTLGHNHPRVNDAIKEQLKNGISFSLPAPFEAEVGQMLIERIPSAQKVRFGKNGNDVTSAAVRVARFHTGRDHILFCGYHGWQDWYISQTSKNGGIPDCVKKLSHRFTYNDIDSLTELIKKYENNIACIIMEPITARDMPTGNFLEKVRDIADKHKIVLIFDEVVTGFRFHKAGAQSLLGVSPDLSCFSKAISNGLPLSVLVGKDEIMSKFKDIFFSVTNAGETLSLAAAKAVIQFHDEVDVVWRLFEGGRKLKKGLQEMILKYDLSDRVEILGSDCRFGINFFDKNNPVYDSSNDLLFFVQLAVSQGILTGGWHMISYAHTDSIINETLQKYDIVFSGLKQRFNSKKEQ
jgi:glutamate-1-semialdehyde aminotransferase